MVMTYAQYLASRDGRIHTLENSSLELSTLIEAFSKRADKILADPKTTLLRKARAELHRKDLFTAEQQLRNLTSILRSTIDWLCSQRELLWSNSIEDDKF